MPYSTIANRRDPLFDKLLELRSYSASAISATTAETGVLCYPTKLLAARLVVNVAAHTGYSAGTALWTLTLEASTALASGYSVIATITPVGTANEFEVGLTGNQVNAIVADATYLRINATKTGSPGSLTYGAFLARIDG